MAEIGTLNGLGSPVEASKRASPPRRMRLHLKTAEDVRAELARLYREGKSGTRDVSDVSRLANVLGLLGRLIETGDLEARLQKLEKSDE